MIFRLNYQNLVRATIQRSLQNTFRKNYKYVHVQFQYRLSERRNIDIKENQKKSIYL